MKKKMIAAGGALVLGAVILPVGIHALAANLTETKALEIALKHAGLSADAIAYSSTELDFEDGRQVFEVEFYTKDFKEYDYEIDPSSGAILSVDYDAEDYQIKRGQDGSAAASISLEKAKKIALKHAGFTASDITFVKAEQDVEDGRLCYEIEFVTNGYKEYDYEIDAASGDILSWDYDAENHYDTEHHYDEHDSDEHHDDDHYSDGHHDDGHYSDEHHDNKHYSDGHHDDGHYFEEHHSNGYNSDKHHSGTQQGESVTISLEEAKAAALKKAGLKASQVTFTKAKRDFDDGKMTYEIEFRSGGMEYEAEIDAQTGNVVDWECER